MLKSKEKLSNKEIHDQKIKEHWEKLKRDISKAETEEQADTYRYFANLTVPCCHNEDRGWNGGCKTCGDPCF